MSESEYPVSVAVRRPDGSVEKVRVGTAVKGADGFVLRLGELTIGETAAPAEPRPAARVAAGPSGPLPTAFPNYGRSKGAPIAGASRGDLEFYANGAKRTLSDPSKARFHDKERGMLAALEAEMARQGGGSQPEEPPLPSDPGGPEE